LNAYVSRYFPHRYITSENIYDTLDQAPSLDDFGLNEMYDGIYTYHTNSTVFSFRSATDQVKLEQFYEDNFISTENGGSIRYDIPAQSDKYCAADVAVLAMASLCFTREIGEITSGHIHPFRSPCSYTLPGLT
jgi:hypothetical protein